MKKYLTSLLCGFLALLYLAYESGEFRDLDFSTLYFPPFTAEKWEEIVTTPPQEEPPPPLFIPEPPPEEPEGDAFTLDDLPAYDGFPYTIVHGNEPYFPAEELTTSSYESYAPLDDLGRCGVTVACIGPDLMPTQERGEIGQVKPTGWHTVKYDCVNGKYLYNRCHLIGYQLTGENANTCNLITGTRALNIEGMLPFENMVAEYVEDTGNHVLYRVTPVFLGQELLCRGVLMEGRSVEDDQIIFCVFAFNAQPGIDIDYATGESSLAA